MDTGVEEITDTGVANATRAQARRVQWSAALATVLITVLYLTAV